MLKYFLLIPAFAAAHFGLKLIKTDPIMGPAFLLLSVFIFFIIYIICFYNKQ